MKRQDKTETHRRGLVGIDHSACFVQQAFVQGRNVPSLGDFQTELTTPHLPSTHSPDRAAQHADRPFFLSELVLDIVLH